MTHIIISRISSDALVSGALSPLIAELYAQKKIIEVNPWHDHQSVFDHTALVVKNAEMIMQCPFCDVSEKKKLLSHLHDTVGEVKRKDIILFSALLHDIAKGGCLEVHPLSGQTSCPLHEIKGRAQSVAILSRWGLSDIVIQKVSKIILFHGHIHEAVNEILRNGADDQILDVFHDVVGDIFFELLTLGYADTAGSDLPKLNHADFVRREEIYRNAIRRYAASL